MSSKWKGGPVVCPAAVLQCHLPGSKREMSPPSRSHLARLRPASFAFFTGSHRPIIRAIISQRPHSRLRTREVLLVPLFTQVHALSYALITRFLRGTSSFFTSQTATSGPDFLRFFRPSPRGTPGPLKIPTACNAIHNLTNLPLLLGKSFQRKRPGSRISFPIIFNPSFFPPLPPSKEVRFSRPCPVWRRNPPLSTMSLFLNRPNNPPPRSRPPASWLVHKSSRAPLLALLAEISGLT